MVKRVDRASLLSALKEKMNSWEPGMMFVTPEKGHPFVIAFKEGVLVSIYSGNVKGLDALHLLGQVESAGYRFNATSAPVVLPGTEVTAQDSAFLFDIPASATAAPLAAETPTSAPSAVDFHGAAITLVRENLTDVMGPFAMVTLEDALKLSGSTVFGSAEEMQGLLQKLVAEIDDNSESSRFIEQTMDALIKLEAISLK